MESGSKMVSVRGPLTIEHVEGPIVACALHAGHVMRPELRSLSALSSFERYREEDPYTDVIADVGVTRVRATTSRFEFDLNRARARAVYLTPDDAWGLTVWKRKPSAGYVGRSLELYDECYRVFKDLLEGKVRRHGYAIVLDVHSYNHRRDGAGSPPADPGMNPEVNVGTGALDRARWELHLREVCASFRSYGLDVRENVRFRGGHFATWAREVFNGDVAVFALEFKKTFMDEWSGEVDWEHVARLRDALCACARKLTRLAESSRLSLRDGTAEGVDER